MAFAQRVLLGSIVAVCAGCGGRPAVDGKAFLLGQTDHSGIRVLVLRGSEVVATARTDGDGTYRVEAPGGAYDLRFEHDGYQAAKQPDVVIGSNDVSVPETTLRRGALLASAPIFSAQALGSTKALVQFADGIDAPSHIVDLASGKTRQVAAGRVTVLDGNEQFATVRIQGLYRLELATAELVPVDPPEGVPGRGFAAAGYYFYLAIDGKLNALATGSQSAVSFDTPVCSGFGTFSGSARADTPGWITVAGIQRCNGFAVSALVNPALRIVSGPFSSVFVKSGIALLLDASSPGFNSGTTLRKLDLASGVETTIREGILQTGLSRDGNTLFVEWKSNSAGLPTFSFVDLRTGTATDAVRDAFVSQSYPSGLLLATSAAMTIVRIDTGRATRLCTGFPSTVFKLGVPNPIAFVCSESGTIRVYEWESDSIRTLSTSSSGISLLGRVIVWSEGEMSRAARVGSGDAPVTLCPTRAGLPAAISGDGEAAALFCPDGADPTGRWVAVDLRTGVSQVVLAAIPGSGAAINPTATALGPRGRGVTIAYSTDAPPSDPVNCGAPVCTLFFDRETSSGAIRNDLQSVLPPPASPDDHGFLVNDPSLNGRSLIVSFGAGAPAFASVPRSAVIFGIGASGRAALLLSSASFPPDIFVANLVSGTTSPVKGSPVPVGSSSDFVVAEGIADLDSGIVETLPAGWRPLCDAIKDPLVFFDATGTVLQEYRPGSSVQTMGSGVRSVAGSCFETFQLFAASSDGIRGTLLRYAQDTGALTQVADDVSPTISGAVLDRFAFQHPDLVSGDLLLLSADNGSVLPLGARAHLQTRFAEAGKRVAFTGGTANGEPQLMAAKLDGSGARTVGPAADRVIFSPDGVHLVFEARGLLWSEDPKGPAVALDELERTGKVVVSGSGQYVLYSVITGERRGTYRIDLGPSCTASVGGCTAPAAVF